MYIALAVIIVLIFLVIIIYNTMLSKKNKMLKSYSSLDVMLKKRYDLIPNIVEAVKGYKEYEANTLKQIISLRSKADDCKNIEDINNLNSKYMDFMSDIDLLSENYPDLKASENFMHLQRVLNEVEEQISAARRTYNAHVESYNTYISLFPLNIIAFLFGFRKYKFFEMSQEEKDTKVSVGNFDDKEENWFFKGNTIWKKNLVNFMNIIMIN